MKRCDIPRLRVLLTLLGFFVVAAGAGATDRFYPDIVANSPDERYTLEAKSPDNANGPVPFASNFVYTLTDAQSGDVVWRRAQPEREGSPVSVYLHNDGWVTVWTGYNELLVLDPKSADVMVSFRILDAFNKEEHDRYVHQTSAGPRWSSYSRWYYLESGDDLLFVIRPMWGRRLIVDIAAGELLPPDDERFIEACQEAEQEFMRGTLEEAAAEMKPFGFHPEARRAHDVLTAIIMAAQNQDRSAIEPLRALQHSSYSGSSGGWWDFDGKYAADEINPFIQTEMTIRRASHDALRLLKEKPEELPCTLFRAVGSEGPGNYVQVPELPAPRATRVELVTRAATPRQVLEAIGAPDYVNFADLAWEYHMDTDEPYTLQVIFPDKKRVDGLRRTPPVWQQDDEWLQRLR